MLTKKCCIYLETWKMPRRRIEVERLNPSGMEVIVTGGMNFWPGFATVKLSGVTKMKAIKAGLSESESNAVPKYIQRLHVLDSIKKTYRILLHKNSTIQSR